MDSASPVDETVTEDQQQHKPIYRVLLSEPLLPPHPDDRDKLDLQNSAAPFIARCSTLLEEIHKVQAFIKQNYLREIELRAFRSHVQSELRFLKNVSIIIETFCFPTFCSLEEHQSSLVAFKR